jgi:YVTN family beta-propeller protein
VIDYASKKVVDTIAANARGANRLKFTPDGKLAFVSTLSGGELIILDAGTHKELKRLKLGRGAAGILMQPDGRRAFVACSPDNNIAVIDLKSLEVVSRLEVGEEPDGLAWSSR